MTWKSGTKYGVVLYIKLEHNSKVDPNDRWQSMIENQIRSSLIYTSHIYIYVCVKDALARQTNTWTKYDATPWSLKYAVGSSINPIREDNSSLVED